MSNKEKKQKKEKPVYVDDGRSFADMSMFRKEKEETPTTYQTERPLPRWRQIINTYFESVRMMFLPMLAFMGGIALLFFILWLIFSQAGG